MFLPRFNFGRSIGGLRDERTGFVCSAAIAYHVEYSNSLCQMGLV
jgi:hypothetical protein